MCSCSCICVCVCPPSSSPAHQPSHSPSEGRSGPSGAAVVGARQRRPVSSALLHGAAPRAPREQLDSPLCLRQPRSHVLHSVQVGSSHQLTASGYSQGWGFILFPLLQQIYFYLFSLEQEDNIPTAPTATVT